MITLKLKNKIELGIRSVIKEALDKGGIPDHIELYPEDADNLLREMWNLRDNQDFRDNFIIQDVLGVDQRLNFWSGQDHPVYHMWLRDWQKHSIVIKYRWRGDYNKDGGREIHVIPIKAVPKPPKQPGI